MNVSKSHFRTVKEINHMISNAKIDESELTSTTQAVFHTLNDGEFENFCFLELDDFLQKQMFDGKALIFKGEGEESLVLCTHECTFSVREAETSNSFLLMNDLEWFEGLDCVENKSRIIKNKYVTGIFNSYLEVKECCPRIKKLVDLLEETKYTGPENEENIDRSKLLTFNEILMKIQASEYEIKKALVNLKVLEINGFMRILDLEYHFRAMNYMLRLIDENSWSLDEIDRSETVNCLRELIPVNILEQLFDLHTEKSFIKEDQQLYKYNELAVCRLIAESILNVSGRFKLNEFLETWKGSVPDGMSVSEDMLQGIALIDRDSTPSVIWHFREEHLPELITDRFEILFQMKKKWTREEIIPYIERLATKKIDVNTLVTKYSRSATVNGFKYYFPKHGK